MLIAAVSSQAQLLWKVESPNSTKVSYILGTHHFAPVEILDSIAGLDKALSDCDKLYGEVDMEIMTNPTEMMKFTGQMIAPTDSTLTKILSAAELDTVTATWNKICKGVIPLETMYQMKPSVISTTFMSMIMVERFPDKDFKAPGIDQLMQIKAKERNKVVAGLEDVNFQVRLLYGAPIREQKEALMNTVRDGGESQIQETNRLTDAYMARDINKLEAIMTDPELMTEAEADRMVYDRNAKWADILAPEMADTSLMVVVGAGHLPSDKGLIELLRKRGFTVTPVD